jgi:hypothetical protein
VVETWGGACSGCSGKVCVITVTGNTSCSVSLTFVKPARIGTVDYDTLQAAYDAAATGATILAREYTFGSLTCNQAKNLTILGGYDKTYTTHTGSSIITGRMTIGKGSLVVDRVIIK